MTDRELLEKAAKSAGYVVESFRKDGGAWCYPAGEQPDEDGDHPGLFAWNPLEDDGDALRLAVKLKFDINIWEEGCYVVATTEDDPLGTELAYEMSSDIASATRRAIVRAAAAMSEAE